MLLVAPFSYSFLNSRFEMYEVPAGKKSTGATNKCGDTVTIRASRSHAVTTTSRDKLSKNNYFNCSIWFFYFSFCCFSFCCFSCLLALLFSPCTSLFRFLTFLLTWLCFFVCLCPALGIASCPHLFALRAVHVNYFERMSIPATLALSTAASTRAFLMDNACLRKPFLSGLWDRILGSEALALEIPRSLPTSCRSSRAATYRC